MCDLAYVLLVERVDAQTLADRHVAAVLKAAGSEVDLPDVQEQRDVFDAALIAEPTAGKHVDAEQMELRRALGVA